MACVADDNSKFYNNDTGSVADNSRDESLRHRGSYRAPSNSFVSPTSPNNQAQAETQTQTKLKPKQRFLPPAPPPLKLSPSSNRKPSFFASPPPRPPPLLLSPSSTSRTATTTTASSFSQRQPPRAAPRQQEEEEEQQHQQHLLQSSSPRSRHHHLRRLQINSKYLLESPVASISEENDDNRMTDVDMMCMGLDPDTTNIASQALHEQQLQQQLPVPTTIVTFDARKYMSDSSLSGSASSSIYSIGTPSKPFRRRRFKKSPSSGGSGSDSSIRSYNSSSCAEGYYIMKGFVTLVKSVTDMVLLFLVLVMNCLSDDVELKVVKVPTSDDEEDVPDATISTPTTATSASTATDGNHHRVAAQRYLQQLKARRKQAQENGRSHNKQSEHMQLYQHEQYQNNPPHHHHHHRRRRRHHHRNHRHEQSQQAQQDMIFYTCSA